MKHVVSIQNRYVCAWFHSCMQPFLLDFWDESSCFVRRSACCPSWSSYNYFPCRQKDYKKFVLCFKYCWNTNPKPSPVLFLSHVTCNCMFLLSIGHFHPRSVSFGDRSSIEFHWFIIIQNQKWIQFRSLRDLSLWKEWQGEDLMSNEKWLLESWQVRNISGASLPGFSSPACPIQSLKAELWHALASR